MGNCCMSSLEREPINALLISALLSVRSSGSCRAEDSQLRRLHSAAVYMVNL